MTKIGSDKVTNFKNSLQEESLLWLKRLITRHALILTILLILAGVIVSWVTAYRTNQTMRRDVLKQLEMVASTINVARIKSLSGSENDLQNPDYLRLKQLFSEVKKVDKKIRFIYLMRMEPDGRAIFLVDNEPPDSEDYSAPGDIYYDASTELLQAFESGEPFVEGPEVDEWGVWISPLVPIVDPENNQVVAVIGMDIDAGDWRKAVAARAALPIGMTMIAFLLLASLMILFKNRQTIQQNRLELQALKDFNENIVQNADEGIIVCDESGIIEFTNPAMEKMLGYDKCEMVDRCWLELVPEEERKKAEQADINRSAGLFERYRLALKHKDGYTVPIQISASPRYDKQSGEYRGNLAVMADISTIIRAEAAIRESEEKYRLIFERSPFGVLHYDSNGVITDCNDQFVKIIGSSHQALVGLNMLNLPDQNIVSAVQKSLQGETASYEDDYRSVTAVKTTPVRAIFAPIESAEASYSKAEGGIGIVEDISQRKLAEEKIRHMSFHDQLTDLYNRYYLEEEFKRLDTERQLPLSIIIADVNGLKLINDTYGHLTGDQLLCKAAEIIRKNSRSEDIVARWGGDEFVILLPQTGALEAEIIRKRISAGCEKAYIEDFPVSLALGSATRTDSTKSVSALLKEAEDLMYEQKLIESRSTKSAVLGALLKTLAAKSYETETHTRNMQEIAVKIGRTLGLPDSEINRLILLITLHDIGKINIPEEILTKERPLTEEEWEIIKKHPETGHRIAMATEEFAHVAEDILSHHERYDGLGYPRKLKGDAIPLLARITAVADAFEVMSNGRPYRKAMTREEIIAEFKNCSGSHFDPELVEILLILLG
jgi:diguanylate cyclase (GGDEF)-like protein/PAS domain S-box-containing protein